MRTLIAISIGILLLICPPVLAKDRRHPHERPPHWEHSEIVRPHYFWNWSVLHSVTCEAEDAHGVRYSAQAPTWPGFGLANVDSLEDFVLDRCYENSGHDARCYLVVCFGR